MILEKATLTILILPCKNIFLNKKEFNCFPLFLKKLLIIENKIFSKLIRRKSD